MREASTRLVSEQYQLCCPYIDGCSRKQAPTNCVVLTLMVARGSRRCLRLQKIWLRLLVGRWWPHYVLGRPSAACLACPLAGDFELQPGFTQLTALRELELHGNVASLGDLWQHTALTRLVLLDAEEAFPYPQDGSSSLPGLEVAVVGSSKREMPPFWGGLLSGTLRHVPDLVRGRGCLRLHGWRWWKAVAAG